MAEHREAIDITHVPDLLQLAEEVRRAGTPRVLRRDGEDLAMVVPLPQPKKGRSLSPADYEAFRSAAGGWKDIDTDRPIENIYESRRISTRPPVEL